MTRRIGNRFGKLRRENRAGLVTYTVAGDPDPATSRKILGGLPEAGADFIELGMPFSDPMADGPAIQLASLRALHNGGGMINTLNMVRNFRTRDMDTPIILMGYYNPIHCYGSQRFLDEALDAGVDGLIIVDLPPEEDDELCHPCLTSGLNWIRLTTPTSDDRRLEKVLKHSSGFVYHVSIAGITGTRSAELEDIESAVQRIRRQTDLPVAVGFGIRTAEQVRAISEIADAAVVGSALVNVIREGIDSGRSGDDIAAALHALVRELASGTV